MVDNGRSTGNDNIVGEVRRLRREYDRLPKSPHGETTPFRHPQLTPERIMQAIENPHDQREETSLAGERVTILVGRVPDFNRWVKVVLVGGELETAYPDRRLEEDYGGKPWPEQS